MMFDTVAVHAANRLMSHSSRLLIFGARVYDHAGDVHEPPIADVLIEGSRIAAVGRSFDASIGSESVERIDARGKLLIPGLVNAHYHSYDFFSKGLFEHVPLDLWRQYTARLGAGRSAEEVRLRTLAGAIECLRSGITTVQDMSILAPLDDALVDGILEAYEQAGIRVVFSISLRDRSDVDTLPYGRDLAPELQRLAGDRGASAEQVMEFARRQIERHGTRRARLHWALSPSAPQRCTPELLELIREAAEHYDVPIYTHLYEAKAHAVHARLRYGSDDGSLVRYLQRAGLLSKRLTVAHALWCRWDEFQMLAEHGVSIVINPMSNLKLSDGVPPINEFRRAGLQLAFGCDCFSCSDVQNMFQSMKLACLLSAVDRDSSGALHAAEAIDMATAGGASTAGLHASLGHIRPGMKADLLLLDLSDPAFVPFNSAARQVVFSETGRSVHTVIVDGRIVMRDRRIATLDEEALYREVSERQAAYLREYHEMVQPMGPLRHAFVDLSRRIDAHDVGVDRFP